MSPSTRRAWVEIDFRYCNDYEHYVALYAEGVGRNVISKKRATGNKVALYAEGVGRNRSVVKRNAFEYRRPLRGGRG